MAAGTVKWFNPAKGFGFIEQSDGGADVFAHYSNIADRSLPGLRTGQKVEFEVTPGLEAPYAENIVLV
ncbi:cold-shock protein [Streptomyces sp. NPDC058220]|uniref:cold-shock protein n=1 Tax=unclassified Streptomyces TaxID=2593676 RepID=UPI003646F225